VSLINGQPEWMKKLRHLPKNDKIEVTRKVKNEMTPEKLCVNEAI
jgi:hypothetical protein